MKYATEFVAQVEVEEGMTARLEMGLTNLRDQWQRLQDQAWQQGKSSTLRTMIRFGLNEPHLSAVTWRKRLRWGLVVVDPEANGSVCKTLYWRFRNRCSSGMP